MTSNNTKSTAHVACHAPIRPDRKPSDRRHRPLSLEVGLGGTGMATWVWTEHQQSLCHHSRDGATRGDLPVPLWIPPSSIKAAEKDLPKTQHSQDLLSWKLQRNENTVGFPYSWASPMAQPVNNLRAAKEMQDTQVRFLGGGRSPGEGKDNPFQYSCLENPTDRGTWWATVHGVTESQSD